MQIRDIFPFPGVDRLVKEILSSPPGLAVLAGPEASFFQELPGGVFRPSGRATIFRVLMEDMIAAVLPEPVIIVTTDKQFYRVHGRNRQRIAISLVVPPLTYETNLSVAIRRRPALLILDRLLPETLPLAFDAARRGIRIFSQADTILRGASLERFFAESGIPQEHLLSLQWILSVSRMSALCPNCKVETRANWTEARSLRSWLLSWGEDLVPGGERGLDEFLWEHPFFVSSGCPTCQNTGRLGDVPLLDVFRPVERELGSNQVKSLLARETCALQLALRGQVAISDLFRMEEDLFFQTFQRLNAGEQKLAESEMHAKRLAAELEVANRVLKQRTQVLFSLEEISQALIGVLHLNDLAVKVCRRARDLCGADRVVLYYQQTPEQYVILSTLGWDHAVIQHELETTQVISPERLIQPTPYNKLPPGISLVVSEEGKKPESSRTGLYIPLVAQDRLVGLMIVHSTHEKRFLPGETAILQTFANQAALALQRAGLVEQLEAKIVQLEAAQRELAQKERMEHELELARQVQESMLPRTFPEVIGYQFSARNQPARQVGGDFFDIFQLDDQHFGLVVADVSDKGLPAALYMALTRSLLRAEAQRERSPKKALESVNRLLLDLGEQDMFVTVFYGVVDCAALSISYARAGHDRPFILRGCETINFAGSGLPLGMFGEEVYYLSEEHLALEKGDLLLIYSDGLTDLVAGDRQPLGREALMGIVREISAQPGTSAAEVRDRIFQRLAGLQGEEEQFDDMTLVVVRVA